MTEEKREHWAGHCNHGYTGTTANDDWSGEPAMGPMVLFRSVEARDAALLDLDNGLAAALRTRDVDRIGRYELGETGNMLRVYGLPKLQELCEVWGIKPDAVRMTDTQMSEVDMARASLHEGIQRALQWGPK